MSATSADVCRTSSESDTTRAYADVLERTFGLRQVPVTRRLATCDAVRRDAARETRSWRCEHEREHHRAGAHDRGKLRRESTDGIADRPLAAVQPDRAAETDGQAEED